MAPTNPIAAAADLNASLIRAGVPTIETVAEADLSAPLIFAAVPTMEANAKANRVPTQLRVATPEIVAEAATARAPIQLRIETAVCPISATAVLATAKARSVRPAIDTFPAMALVVTIILSVIPTTPIVADINLEPIQLRAATPDILAAADAMRTTTQLADAVATVPIPDLDPNLKGKVYGNLSNPENLVTTIARIVAPVTLTVAAAVLSAPYIRVDAATIETVTEAARVPIQLRTVTPETPRATDTDLSAA